MWFLTAPIRDRLGTLACRPSEAGAEEERPPTSDTATELVADALAAGFRLVARLRARPALHPRGTVVQAVVVREGLAEPIGVRWTDEPGRDDAVVRLSRATGLPRALPDVLGLAVRIDPDGDPADLLLSTTGRAPGARHVLWPRWDPRRAVYTSVTPYHAPAGSVLVAAIPAPSRGGRPTFHLAVASPAGPWRRFGRLELAGTGTGDADLAFDPVRRPITDLELPKALATLRAAAYRGSREGRAARRFPAVARVLSRAGRA